MRLRPASLYARWRGSVIVPLPLLALPETVTALGETWERKREFHATAVSTRALTARLAAARDLHPADAEDSAWAAITAAIAGCPIGTVTVRAEFRVVRRPPERALIAMAEIEGLAELHERIAAALELPPVTPPAHVTLYTEPGGEGIGLHAPEDLERLSRPLERPPFPWPPDPLRFAG